MLIIVEGPDGAGKTTLAKAISEETGAEYIHAGPPRAHPMAEYICELPRHDAVLDRWHLGEMIYGPLYRGQAGMTSLQFAALEQFLEQRGAVVVLCTGTTRQLVERIVARGDEVHRTLREEVVLWDQMAHRTQLPVIRSLVGMETSVSEVVAFARKAEEAACTTFT